MDKSQELWNIERYFFRVVLCEGKTYSRKFCYSPPSSLHSKSAFIYIILLQRGWGWPAFPFNHPQNSSCYCCVGAHCWPNKWVTYQPILYAHFWILHVWLSALHISLCCRICGAFQYVNIYNENTLFIHVNYKYMFEDANKLISICWMNITHVIYQVCSVHSSKEILASAAFF